MEEDDWSAEPPDGGWAWQLELCQDITFMKKSSSYFYIAKCSVCGKKWEKGTQATRIGNHYGALPLT